MQNKKTINLSGAITSSVINDMLEEVAVDKQIPFQADVRGRDTGTDGMAGFLASIDCASASVGFPIRNMHTVSELGHTGDVLCAIHAMHGLVEGMEKSKLNAEELLTNRHPRLDRATPRVYERAEVEQFIKESEGDK